MTFCKHQKQIFLKNFNFNFYPYPSWRGVLKKWNSYKLVVEHNLLNMIFQSHKMRTKSKRWALYLKNWASYANFHVSTKGKNRIISKFTNLNISFNFWDCSQNFGMSKVTPSMISQGGVFKPLPRSSHRIRYAVGGRTKIWKTA